MTVGVIMIVAFNLSILECKYRKIERHPEKTTTFNLSILECKFHTMHTIHRIKLPFNLSILECKSYRVWGKVVGTGAF